MNDEVLTSFRDGISERKCGQPHLLKARQIQNCLVIMHESAEGDVSG